MPPGDASQPASAPPPVSQLLDALQRSAAEAKPIVRATAYAAHRDGSGGRADVDAAGQKLVGREREAALQAALSKGAHILESWKVLEHAYRSHADSAYKVFPLGRADIPTLARGLFTEQDPSGPRIVARGYDKFFNVNEMPWTRVRLLFPSRLLRHTLPR